MKRFLIVLTIAFALALLGRGGEKIGANSPAPDSEEDAAAPVEALLPAKASQEEKVLATPVLEPGETRAEEAELVPVFFPQAKVVARVREPMDANGRHKVIETVETSMKEKYVRVVRVIGPGTGGRNEVKDEIAMVANQLLLQKPEAVTASSFVSTLTLAGAVEVKEIAEDTFLATFAAKPGDPRVLDDYMTRVRAVAGIDLVVEPNYIRKIF